MAHEGAAVVCLLLRFFHYDTNILVTKHGVEMLHTSEGSRCIYLLLDHLDLSLPLGYVVQGLCSNRSTPGKPVLARANHTAPTRQHDELSHTKSEIYLS